MEYGPDIALYLEHCAVVGLKLFSMKTLLFDLVAVGHFRSLDAYLKLFQES